MKRPHPYVRFSLVIIVIIVAVSLALGNPHSSDWWLKCPLYQLTGWQCPICGLQRGVHQFLHGNLVQAFLLNPGLALASPYIIIIMVGQIVPSWQQKRVVRVCYSDRAIFAFIGYMAVWGVVRNLI